MHPLRIGFGGLEEFRRAHQEGCDVEGAAGDGEADLVARGFDLRLQVLEALDDEGQQAVFARVGLLQTVDLRGRVQDFLREWEFVLAEHGDGTEGRGLRAHPVFGPEAGKEDGFRKGADRFQIVVEVDAVVGEVVEDGVTRPVRKPGAVDDEGCWQRAEGFSANRGDEGVPLLVVHRCACERD